MADIRQSPQYAQYLKSLGWIVERIGGINYFIKKLPLIGSVLKVQRPKTIDFRQIKELSKKYRAFQIIIEPNLESNVGAGITTPGNYHNLLLSHGFKISKSPYLPTKTLHLDLTMPLKFKKETRRAIRKASGPEGLRPGGGSKEYSSPKEIRIFRDAWKKSVKFTRFVPPAAQLINLRKNFPNNNSIFLASHNGSTGSPQVLSGAIFIRTKDIGYYWQAFTNKEGRTSLSQYALLYHGILWAKDVGCKIFDFEGIFDPRFPNRSWLGFTHFKKSFGGYEVEYPRCFTRYNIFPHFQ